MQLNLPAAVTSAVHDPVNRVTNWGSHTLAFDDSGALISDADSSTLVYVWDERQRLKEIKQGTTTIGSFQYDAFNRRVGKTIGGTSTNFLLDGWQVVQELNGTTPSRNLLTGLGVDEIFRRTVGTTIEDFVTDALGSPIALTDSAELFKRRTHMSRMARRVRAERAAATATNIWSSTEILPWFVVQPCGNCVELFLGEDREIVTLGQIESRLRQRREPRCSQAS